MSQPTFEKPSLVTLDALIFYKLQPLIQQSQRINMNPKLLFCIYTYAYFLYGFAINCMGPIIPYFSRYTGVPYTQFSFLFFTRAVGYLVGGYINTKVAKHITPHKLLAIAQFCGGLAFLLSSLNFNFVNLGICFFFGAAACCNITVMASICVLRLFENEHQQFWMQILTIMFGVGGLVAPFFINIFQQKTFVFLGILLITASPIIYFITQPFQSQQKIVESSNNLISSKSQTYFSLLFLLFIGYEFNFSAWAPSYLLLTNSTDIQTATFSASVLWFSNIGARFLMIFFPGKTSSRLSAIHFANTTNIIFVSAVVLLGFNVFGIFYGSLSVGGILSALFPLYYALPNQFQLRLTQKNTAIFMMAASLGEAAITMPVGYAIQIFGPFSLFVSEILIAGLMFFIYKKLVASLEQSAALNYNDKMIPLNNIKGPNSQVFDSKSNLN